MKCLSVWVSLIFSYDWIEDTYLWQEYLLYSPSLHPKGDGGDSTLLLTGVAEHGTEDTGQMRSTAVY